MAGSLGSFLSGLLNSLGIGNIGATVIMPGGSSGIGMLPQQLGGYGALFSPGVAGIPQAVPRGGSFSFGGGGGGLFQPQDTGGDTGPQFGPPGPGSNYSMSGGPQITDWGPNGGTPYQQGTSEGPGITLWNQPGAMGPSPNYGSDLNGPIPYPYSPTTDIYSGGGGELPPLAYAGGGGWIEDSPAAAAAAAPLPYGGPLTTAPSPVQLGQGQGAYYYAPNQAGDAGDGIYPAGTFVPDAGYTAPVGTNYAGLSLPSGLGMPSSYDQYAGFADPNYGFSTDSGGGYGGDG